MKQKKQIMIAAAAAVVVMVFAWYQVVWTGQTKSIAKADGSKASAQAATKQLTGRATQLEQAKADTSRAKLLEKLDAAVPKEPGLSAYLRYVNDLAARTHVTVPSVGHTKPVPVVDLGPAPAPSAVAPSAASPGGATPVTTAASAAASPSSMYQITLNFQAAGTYENLIEFVHQLEASPRLIIVDSLSVTGGATANAQTGAAANGNTADPTVSTTSPANAELTATISARMFSVTGLDTTDTAGASS